MDMNLMLLTNGRDRSCLLSIFGEPLIVFENALKDVDLDDSSDDGEKDFSYSLGLALSTINKI